MTTPAAELAALADRLGSLLAGQQYEAAREALEEYGRRLRAAVESLPAHDPRVPHMEREWRQLVESTRRQVLAGRAHAAARLVRLPDLRGFRTELPRRTRDLLG